MAVYQVRLVNPAINLDRTISVPDDQYILDMACSSCIAKLVSGEVDQSEQKFLQPSELADGYTVTCVAYPLSDCTLETHQEQVLYKSSLYLKTNPAQAD
jgi:ferredoxin